MNIKKLFYYSIFTASIFCYNEIHAALKTAEIKKINTNYSPKTTWKIKPSAFLFQDNTFRSILGQKHFMISAELDRSLNHFFSLFTEVGYLHSHGFSKPNQVLTSIQMVPLTFGVKGTFHINSCLSIYAKAGPTWLYLQENTDYMYFGHTIHKDTFGVTSGLGFLIHALNHLSFDFFSNYIYGKKDYVDKYSNTKIKRYFGGFQFGIGLSFSY